jgi:hypothetical protein
MFVTITSGWRIYNASPLFGGYWEDRGYNWFSGS